MPHGGFQLLVLCEGECAGAGAGVGGDIRVTKRDCDVSLCIIRRIIIFMHKTL